MKAAVYALAAVHMAVIAVNTASIAILFAAEPIYVSLPVSTLLMQRWFSGRCPLTLLENAIRRRAGMREIAGFKQHYLFGKEAAPCPPS